MVSNFSCRHRVSIAQAAPVPAGRIFQSNHIKRNVVDSAISEMGEQLKGSMELGELVTGSHKGKEVSESRHPDRFRSDGGSEASSSGSQLSSSPHSSSSSGITSTPASPVSHGDVSAVRDHSFPDRPSDALPTTSHPPHPSLEPPVRTQRFRWTRPSRPTGIPRDSIVHAYLRADAAYERVHSAWKATDRTLHGGSSQQAIEDYERLLWQYEYTRVYPPSPPSSPRAHSPAVDVPTETVEGIPAPPGHRVDPSAALHVGFPVRQGMPFFSRKKKNAVTGIPFDPDIISMGFPRREGWWQQMKRYWRKRPVSLPSYYREAR